ncbi:HD domain-containing protein 2 [Perkinsus olseni]|uniref:5'-deoxynucleotidase n=1 Tax=Perkinsus olseni TaxID=32597 RepID=A0A7J6LN53_PEROL|nr:HD domain-containing protein 2 [Perkinsus olseni]KAF4660694.1 HD domain-containing protein 2 [Perkinsus olseni]
MGAITSRFSRPTSSSSSAASESAINAEGIVDFMHFLGQLKTLRRTGWVRSGVPDPESDCDHMHRCAVMAMLTPAGKKDFDRQRTIRMALVHDLAEAVAGDITPFCGVSKEEKHQLEREGLKRMLSSLREDPGSRGTAQEIEDLWNEFEAGVTQEAIYAKDIDKFEMVLQAYEYEKAHEGLAMPTFYETTKGMFRTSLFQALDTEVRSRRKRLFEEREQDPSVEHLPNSTQADVEENDEQVEQEETEGAPPAKKARTGDENIQAGEKATGKAVLVEEVEVEADEDTTTTTAGSTTNKSGSSLPVEVVAEVETAE